MRAISRYVAASALFLNTEPTARGLPPGRNSLRLAGNCANRWAFSLVCRWKVRSTTNPRLARAIAGFRVLARLRVPQSRSARCQVARLPGVPTETPLVTSWGVKL